MKRVPLHKVAIIGVGLLGGSIGLALKKNKVAKEIVGYGKDHKKLGAALKKGIITTATTDLAAAIQGSDLVFLCTPFAIFEKLLSKASNFGTYKTVITDVGSVKGRSVAKWESLAKPMRFVASHPMAGGEKKGFENSKADLFKGAACLVTRTKTTDKAAALVVKYVWDSIGCKVYETTPEEHDRLTGKISHLPHAVAFALASAMSRLSKPGDLRYAGKGYWDTTRIAASDPQLWKEIFEHHPEEMVKLLETTQNELKTLRNLLAHQQPSKLKKWLTKASKFQTKAEARHRRKA
jgi:prephenate dehydrogenase